MKLTFIKQLSRWPEQRAPWLALALSSSALVFVALYFQYIMYLEPCVQCIYQRTAMLALAVFAWLGVIGYGKAPVRILALSGWLVAALAGLSSAHHHVWLQTASNPLFASCSPYPDFPSWLPLHEWIPSFFAAGGLCTDNSWSFLGLFMSEWMRIIFAFYAITAVLFIGLYLISLVQRTRAARR